MKLRLTTLAVMAATPALVNAAAIDRSGQSILPFFEKGNYAEVSYTMVDPDIPGRELGSNVNNGNAAKNYGFTTAAIKFSPQPNVAVAILYDEPFGTDYEYTAGNLYNGSSALINSQNITGLVGTRFADRFWIYAGPAFSTGDFAIGLNGGLFQNPRNPRSLPANNKFQQTGNGVDMGYVGGIAYEIPEIALRVAVTYRSEIESKGTWELTSDTVNGPAGRAVVTQPQNVNINFQTGLNPTTLLTADVRWVNFKDLDVISPFGVDLAQYDKDSWAVTLGLGKKLTNNFSAGVRVRYDTGTGQESPSIFGPYDDIMAVQVGGKYKFNKNMDASLGVAYIKLGDGVTKVPSSAPVGAGNTLAVYDDSSAVAVTGKLGFHW